MKILYVSKAILPSETSNSLSIMRVCEAFAGAGHEVTLSGIRQGHQCADIHAYYGMQARFDVRTTSFPSFLSRSRMREYLYSHKARYLAIKIKPDIIYSRLCLRELRRIPASVPVIYEMHSPGHVGRSDKSRTRFEAFLNSKNVVRIVVTTNMLRDYLLQRYPSLDVRLARLSAPLPTPLDPDEAARFKDQELRGRGTFDVGYTGFLDDHGLRGTDILCETAACMSDVDFHIVGGTPAMVAHWVNRAKSSNIYFYGHQNPSKMPGYLAAFDVVMAPLQLQISPRAPFGANMSPLKLPQYFAYGCSILASDVPAHLEILEHERTSLICKAADVDEWVVAIERLRDDSALRHRLGENAKREYSLNYTPQIRVQTILKDLPGITPSLRSMPIDPSSRQDDKQPGGTTRPDGGA